MSTMKKLDRAIDYYSVGPTHCIHLSGTEKINMLELLSDLREEIAQKDKLIESRNES